MSNIPNPLAVLLPTVNDDWRIGIRESALLIVDMQYYSAHPDYGICQGLLENGMRAERAYYTDQLMDIIPRIKDLLSSYRNVARPIFYSVIESLVPDGSDRCRRHKRVGLYIPPGSKEGEVIAELAPRSSEAVLRKTTASVFNSTSIDRVLRNMCIDILVVCGVVTNGCVESSIRDAADLSYDVILVGDCCAALTEDLHNSALRTLQHGYCSLAQAGEISKLLR